MCVPPAHSSQAGAVCWLLGLLRVYTVCSLPVPLLVEGTDLCGGLQVSTDVSADVGALCRGLTLRGTQEAACSRFRSILPSRRGVHSTPGLLRISVVNTCIIWDVYRFIFPLLSSPVTSIGFKVRRGDEMLYFSFFPILEQCRRQGHPWPAEDRLFPSTWEMWTDWQEQFLGILVEFNRKKMVKLVFLWGNVNLSFLALRLLGFSFLLESRVLFP